MRRTLVIGLAMLVVVGCAPDLGASVVASPTGPGSSASASPAATRMEGGVMELDTLGAELAPGRYTRSGFVPPISFELRTGWTAEQAAPGFFDVQRDAGTLDVIAVQFGRVVGHEAAADASRSIAGNPQLTVVVGPEPATVAGVEGIRLVVDTADGVDTQPPVFRQVLAVEAGPLSIASNRRLEIILLDVDDGLLAVLVGGSIRRWDDAVAAAAPVLASLRIGE